MLLRLDRLLEARFPRWFLGWREICRNADERTVISTLLPQAAFGNKILLVLLEKGTAKEAVCLQAVLSSFVLDYIARQKYGGTSLSYYVVKQLPVLPPTDFSSVPKFDATVFLSDWLIPRTLELTVTAEDMRDFAVDADWDARSFCWDEERRFLLRCELDAAFFHLYGIERADVDYIMDTFPIVRRKDEAAHGEYRTKHVILEMYDEMAQAARTGTPYQTRLDPPPADPSVAHPPRAQEPVEA